MKLILLSIVYLLILPSCEKKTTLETDSKDDLQSTEEVEEKFVEFELPESGGSEQMNFSIRALMQLSLEYLIENQTEATEFYTKESKRIYDFYETRLKNRKGRMHFKSFKDFYFEALTETIKKYPSEKDKLTKFVELQTKEKL